MNVREVRDQLRGMSLAESTRAQYGRWIRKYEGWRLRQKRAVRRRPIAESVGDYLATLYLMGKGGQAKMAKAAILSKYPEAASKELNRLARGIEAQWRLEGHGRSPRDALPRAALKAFVMSKPKDYSEFNWRRDRCLALLAVRTMRRPAELLALAGGDVDMDRDGVERSWPHLRFRKSKNDRLGEFGSRFWLPLDRSFTAGCDSGSARLARGATSRGEVAVHVQGRRLGRRGAHQRPCQVHCRAHILGIFVRIAGASWAAAAGLSVAEIQAIGGWRSEAVLVYLRALGSASRSVSRRMGL